ncbi:MAG: RagB/SusD family nutrient uptake outer membrane protein [Salinibacter sp.]|uniref:RagB/SusD family nutrient uptake outer membrane protein n=1 Tax=Salinibacter sp. TaxID=2065818 RepID=UPI0035D4BB9A
MFSRFLSRTLLPIALIAAVFALTSCDKVGVQPKGLAAADNIFQQDGAYKSYLAKLYAGLNVTGQTGPFGNPDIEGIDDEGFSQYIRLWWQLQELPTDEAVLAYSDAPVQEMNTSEWGDQNGFLSGMYSRVSFQVMQVNNFLKESTPAKLNQRNVSSDVREKMPQWRAEARFLRALSYWHGLDLFGGIPIVTEEDPIGGEPPQPNTRQEVFEYVESELIAITNSDGEENLPPIGQAQYGRADRAAAYMVLANLYLNAEVYIGEARYSDAIEYTSRIIDSGAYSLQTEGRGGFSAYERLFLADNQNANGLIFSIPHDGSNTQHYGGTQFLTHAAVGPPMDSTGNINQDYGVDFGYRGLRVTAPSYNLFSSADDRGIFYTTAHSLEINNLKDFRDGYAAPKYKNVTSNGNPGQNLTFPDTDYPMFRLAEAYLIYAEAVLRGGSGGSESQARTLINDLRERAGLGRDVGTQDGPSLTLDFILDERGRELFWEARRRMDLIRYGQFTGDQYLWPWKGGVKGGTSIEDYRALYPIPASELQVNPNLEQNPGY